MWILFIIPVIFFIVAGYFMWRSSWASKGHLGFRRSLLLVAALFLTVFIVLPVSVMIVSLGDCVLRSWGIETKSDGYFCGEAD